jgi:hypothetical protein
MPGLDRMTVEIDVRVEILSAPVLVRAAAEVPGIVEEIFDARDAPDEIEQRLRADEVVERGICRPEIADLSTVDLLPGSPFSFRALPRSNVGNPATSRDAYSGAKKSSMTT